MRVAAPKIVFMGTPDFAVPVLDAIVQKGYNVVAVVTASDKPAGRGKKLHVSPVKEYAIKNNLTLLQPEKLRNKTFVDTLKKLNPDIQVVVAFRMLPRVVWEIPDMGTFNLHASLLPQYRGAAPINHAIINGENETGLTTFFIDDKIDTGNIILQKKVLINEDDNFLSLHDRMMTEGATLVLQTLDLIIKGASDFVDQNALIDDGEELKSAPRIFKEDCRIHWDRPVGEVYNFIRGLSPWPVAFTNLIDGEGNEYYIKIYKTAPIKSVQQLQPGMVETDNKTFIKIYCNDGFVQVLELQMAGKRKMTTEELLRGFSFKGEVKALLPG
ncbi:MAG: methionyl-tRNA formyltransferase [Bacteroidetes bacterium]|nr:MAG: methionyl-tRNA formyltransferase [Bacteroidota bacterium]